MDRVELARMSGQSVRSNNTLFSFFRKYLEEDAAYVFPSGQLPAGCFGCQFANNFRLWSNYVLKGTKKDKKMDSTKTYKLRRSGFIAYFKGGFLSKKSTDEQWQEWINYPKSESEVKKRKAEFSVLPEVVEKVTTDEEKVEIQEEVKKKSEPKKSAGAVKKKRGRKSK